MGTRIPSHKLSNGLYVSGRPDHLSQPTIGSRPTPYTGGDVKNSGELGKMFHIPVSEHPPPLLKSQRSGSLRSSPNSGSGPISMGAFGSGPVPTGASWSGPVFHRDSGSGALSIGASGSEPVYKVANWSGPAFKRANGSGPIFQTDSGSGAPGSGHGSRRATGSGPIVALQPTGLITSGQLRQLELTAAAGSAGKMVYGTSVTTLGYDEVRLGFRVSRKLMWVLLVMVVIGLMVGAFLTVAVKKPVILVVVAAVLVPAMVVILWNCVWKKRGLLGFLRKYPNAELRGAIDGQFVKVTGIVTCGSIPLESSFQKVPRCVYVSTELYEYKGFGGKSSNANYRCFSWGCSNSEKYVADFYISDFQSGLRALVKAGYGAKVAPFVKETTVVDITKENRDLSPNFLSWLADRKLTSDDRVMRLKEGYIKEGSTVSVMGVIRRHEKVLMIVPPTEAMSTGCRWGCGLLPTYVEGLVLTCNESQNVAAIPV